MIGSLGRELKADLAFIYDESVFKGSAAYVYVANLALDAVEAIHIVLDHRDEPQIRIARNSGAANVFTRSNQLGLEVKADKTSFYIKASGYVDCMTTVAQTVFNRYRSTLYEELSGGGMYECRFQYRSEEMRLRTGSAVEAYVSLRRAFSDARLVRAEVTSDGAEIDRREYNARHWLQRARDHPYLTLEYGHKVMDGRLIRAGVGNMLSLIRRRRLEVRE